MHIVINSLRIEEVPLLPYMERPADTREGCKHCYTDAAMEYFKAEVMEMCHAEQTQFEKTIDAELRRLADEDGRQNKRIDALEESFQQTGALASPVEKLAVNMEGMLKEQERQGQRLETLEKRDGEKWRNVAGYVTTAIIGLLIGFVCRQIGIA